MTLYLTFSRGAIWVLPIGFVLYVLLAQPRGLLTALPAAGIPAAIAAKVAYGNELLARADYDSSAAAASQGRHVALVVLACAVGAALLRAAALPLDKRLEAIRIAPERLRLLRVGVAVGLVVALGVGAVVADAPRRISDARATFSEGRYMDYSSDLRSRLTSAVDNGRIDNWRVALDGFDDQPLHGTGAGTYRITWDHDRPAPPIKVNDGHSLYLETLSELGVVGLVLLLVVLGTILGAGVVRLGGAERHAHGAFVAAGTMLAVHAAIDWDWEMPALFVWLFGAGGVALAARKPRFVAASKARVGELGRMPRVVAALAVLVLALTPALFAYSQSPLDRAVTAFAARDCATAIDAALTATERFGTRPEPWQVLGYCDARLGQYDARPARDGRGPLARSEQLAARLRPGDRLRRLGPGCAAVRRRGAAAEPARRARPGAGARISPPQRPRPAGEQSPCGPRFPSNETPGADWPPDGNAYSERVRRRRTRPPLSSARPPSRTGIAAKPVNGSSLPSAAAACWRVGWDSSAGETPPSGEASSSAGDAGEVSSATVVGAFSSSAGRTPPSVQTSAGVTPPFVLGVGVAVHTGVAVGVGVGVGVAYWEIAALLPDCVTPEMARPAPAVLNSIPATSMPRMAKRDFMDWLLREGFAALRRTRCLIASSSSSVACGRSSFKS